jgi:hypothetical protein
MLDALPVMWELPKNKVRSANFPGGNMALIALAVDPQLVQVVRNHANPNVMAGLDPAIHAASAPFGSHFRFS